MMAQAEDDDDSDDDESESVRAWLLRDTGPGVSQDYLSWSDVTVLRHTRLPRGCHGWMRWSLICHTDSADHLVTSRDNS